MFNTVFDAILAVTCSLLAMATDQSASRPATSASARDPRTPPATPWVEWSRAPDPQSGYPVWRLSTAAGAAVAPYFEGQAFTADDRYVVFATDRWGDWKLVRVELATGQCVLVPIVGDNFGQEVAWTIRPGTNDLYWTHGPVLLATDVHTFTTRRVVDLTGKVPGRIRWSHSYTTDGIYTVVTGHTDPATQLYRVNLNTAQVQLVHTWPGPLSHPLINPADPDLITFVPAPDTQNDMSLPMDKRARNWIIDCRTGKARQFLTCPYGFRATHETWTADGQRFYFFMKTEPGWVPASVCSINRAGGDWQKHFTSSYLLGHGVRSTDGRWFIADTQSPNQNPLILIDLRTGNSRIVCWPNSSITAGHPKHAHVHPSLSVSGKYAAFTSDASGAPQAYVVPLEPIMRDLDARRPLN